MTNLVLLHPFPFDSRFFDRLSSALADSGITVLTPDLHGGDRAPSLDHLADEVIALLDAAGIGRAVVGGVSMGGYVTLNLLSRHPDRLLGLILVDTKSAADTAEAVANRHSMAERADRGELPAAADLMPGMVSQYTLDHRPAVVEALDQVISTQTAADVGWNQRAMAARPDTSAALAATGLPVLIIVGAQDQITPPATARAMAVSVAQSRLVIVPEAGHLAAAEDALSVAGSIVGWMGEAVPHRM